MIVNKFDVFLFDLDGVIYIGDEALPEAVESLKLLRQNRKTIRFLTNNPCTTRRKIAERLNALGIETTSEEVVTSSWATAQYLQDENIKNVFVLGDENLKWECQQVGINIDEPINTEAVVVGWDGKLCFNDIKEAVKLIMVQNLLGQTLIELFPVQRDLYQQLEQL